MEPLTGLTPRAGARMLLGLALLADGRRRIGRITGRFAAPVPMPGALTIRAWTDGRFEVLLPDGSAALTDGRVHWRVSSP